MPVGKFGQQQNFSPPVIGPSPTTPGSRGLLLRGVSGSRRSFDMPFALGPVSPAYQLPYDVLGTNQTFSFGMEYWLAGYASVGYQMPYYVSGPMSSMVEQPFALLDASVGILEGNAIALPKVGYYSAGESSAARYRDMVMSTSGLLSYWPLDESSGTKAYDPIGGVDGTYVSTYTLNQTGPMPYDQAERSVALTTAAGHIDIGDVYPFLGTAPFSVECWFNWSGPGVSNLHTLVAYSDATSAYGWWLYIHTPSTSLWLGRYDVLGYEEFGPFTISTNVWYHSVFTYDSTNITLYINGAYVDSMASPTILLSRTSNLRIGTYPMDGATGNFGGNISNVAIYNRHLTATEVLAHYNAGKGV